MPVEISDQSEYYRRIAKEFLQRRGAPFFLSPRDMAVIAGWEARRVPLAAVLEGIDRAFERSKSRACTDTSSPPVGSSIKTRRGPVTRLRAI